MADWNKILSRGDVGDRRSMTGVALGGFGSVVTLIVLAINFLNNPDPAILGQLVTQLQQTQVSRQNLDPNQFKGADSYETFASTVLGSNNDLWKTVFSQNDQTYTAPKLVLFRATTQSGCGLASSQIGPFYCPLDQTIYLDETFFGELQKRYGAKGGDVAEAYVIAHEVGHHVQQQLGALKDNQSNQESIKTELQADCYAGVWAYSVAKKGVFEKNEINEARDAAAAVGDDRIQQKAQGRVNPESWTHGSSQQRTDWFNRGFDSGDPSTRDTSNS